MRSIQVIAKNCPSALSRPGNIPHLQQSTTMAALYISDPLTASAL